MKNKISTPAELTAAAATAGIALENLRNQVSTAAAGVLKFTSRPDGDSGAKFCNPAGVWIRDLVAPPHEVGESWSAIIAAVDGKIYEQDFTIEAGTVKFTGEPREVSAQVEYVPAAAEASAQPRKEDGKFHSADKASAEADAESEGCETCEDHEAAAALHDKAAALHEADGNVEKASEHKQKAANHRSQASIVKPAKAEASAPHPGPLPIRSANAEREKTFPLEAAGEMLSAAPDSAEKFSKGFMVMAGGVRTVTLGCFGQPLEITINVNPASAAALQKQLEAVNASTNQRCFNCFDHGGSRGQTAASSWPKQFFWNGNKSGVYEIAEPSKRGLEAVDGKIYRGFSMTFFTDAEISEVPELEGGGYEIKAGKRGSPENPANIICPADARQNPTAYLNMGTMTNKPAFSANEPLFASAPDAKNQPSPVAPARQAGALPTTVSSTTERQNMKETQSDAAALQARNQQLEQRIAQLEADDTAVAKAQLEAAKAELETNKTKMLLAEAQQKTTQLEAAETKRKEAEADKAVAAGIEAQAIPMLDKELQASWRAKFIADPTLIPLMAAQWQKKAGASARSIPNAAAAVFGYGDVKSGAGVVLKALEACLQKQRPIRGLDAESNQKRSIIARDIATIYRNEVRSKTMQLDAEGQPMPGINPDFLLAPLEAATDADNLGTLAGTLVSMRYLDIFMYKLPLIANGKVMTDFSDQPSDLNQTTSTRKIVVPSVVSFDNTLDTDGYPKGWAPVSAPQAVDVNITLDELIGSPIQYDLATLSSTQRALFMEQAPAAAYANALYFLKKIYAVCTAANFNAYAAVTAADANGIVKVPTAYATYACALIDFARSKMAEIAAAFDANEVPDEDRSLLLNSQYYNRATTDPSVTTFFAGQQAPEIVTQGRLPNLAGFVPTKAPNFPGTNNRVGIALQKNGLLCKSRLPNNLNQILPGAGNGSVTQIVHPETGVAMLLVQWVDHKRGYSAWLPCAILGAAKGDARGGLVLTSQ